MDVKCVKFHPSDGLPHRSHPRIVGHDPDSAPFVAVRTAAVNFLNYIQYLFLSVCSPTAESIGLFLLSVPDICSIADYWYNAVTWFTPSSAKLGDTLWYNGGVWMTKPQGLKAWMIIKCHRSLSISLGLIATGNE